ncbi:MAG: DKNYY domain-containing protein [Candidatus Moranbacteria bacterium]|nr:DKNYY domain-containing protein [Candidatus Moranbacteria bacterium]
MIKINNNKNIIFIIFFITFVFLIVLLFVKNSKLRLEINNLLDEKEELNLNFSYLKLENNFLIKENTENRLNNRSDHFIYKEEYDECVENLFNIAEKNDKHSEKHICTGSYKKENGFIYAGVTTGMLSGTWVKTNIDYDSFEKFDDSFGIAKDKNNIYINGCSRLDIDYRSFQSLGFGYFKDKGGHFENKNRYFNAFGKVISLDFCSDNLKLIKNPSKLQISYDYVTDGCNLYKKDLLILKNIKNKVDDLEVLSSEIFRDKKYIYQIVRSNPKNVITHLKKSKSSKAKYLKNRYYLITFKQNNIDIESFKYVGYLSGNKKYFKDKDFLYKVENDQILTKVKHVDNEYIDTNSIRIEKNIFKDKNNCYVEGYYLLHYSFSFEKNTLNLKAMILNTEQLI